MSRRLVRLARSTGRVVLFLSVWLVVAIVPVAAWEEPAVLVGHPSLLRLYWEAAPLTLTMVVTCAFVVLIDKGRVGFSLTTHPWRDSVTGVVVGLLWVGTVTLTLWSGGFLSVTGANPVPLFVVYAAALFANTCTQELLVHGYLFSYLRGRHGTLAAVVVTTVMFTAVHGGALSEGPLATLNVLAAGLFLALLLIASGGLWLPIVAHFLWNLAGGMVLGQVALGEDLHWLRTTITGPEWVSGGSARMEGGVVTLATTLILCSVGAVVVHRQRQRAS
ncbi:MAG: type II CAAX endopeptidase family protein [Ornithinibacter sp.]